MDGSATVYRLPFHSTPNDTEWNDTALTLSLPIPGVICIITYYTEWDNVNGMDDDHHPSVAATKYRLLEVVKSQFYYYLQGINIAIAQC